MLIQLMASKRRRWLTEYLLTIKHGKDESLETYLSKFNKECITTNNQDEKITLVVRHCVGIHDYADNFINTEDTLHALTELRKELEGPDKKGKAPSKGKAREKAEIGPSDDRREEAPARA